MTAQEKRELIAQADVKQLLEVCDIDELFYGFLMNGLKGYNDMPDGEIDELYIAYMTDGEIDKIYTEYLGGSEE